MRWLAGLHPSETAGRLERSIAAHRGPPADPGSLPYPDRPAGTDCLPEIRHIVIVMMENHSFDNYLGVLGRGDGLPTDDAGNVAASNPASGGRFVPATHFSTTRQHVGVPTQSWEASHLQWGGGTNAGFATAVERCAPSADPTIAMGYWTAQDLPFYSALADVFPVADRWFASCLGPTIPNRRFLISGTANGLTSDTLSHCFDYPPNGTIFDLLSRHGIAWRNYHSVSRFRPLLKRLTGRHGIRSGRYAAWGFQNLADRLGGGGERAKSYLQFTADAYPLGLLRYLAHLRSVDDFVADAARGALPAVSIVDPDFRADSEENPQDVRLGESFAGRVINAAMHGADWIGTFLVWCYDEHGGYYDHVPPPEAPTPDDRGPDAPGPFGFDRYGFRVPAVIVSPFAKQDYVSHVVRDHTSLLKLIERKWNLPPLTMRDAAADDLLDAVDFTAPPAFVKPPPLAPPSLWRSTDRRRERSASPAPALRAG
jgi:phospholipase C